MARWSDLMKLNKYEDFEDFLRGYCGCYEIGFARNEEFYPKYIGRGGDVWDRIKTYMNPKRCHNMHIREKIDANRHNLWFRVTRVERYHGLESRSQIYFGVGQDGLYAWNQRTEWKHRYS